MTEIERRPIIDCDGGGVPHVHSCATDDRLAADWYHMGRNRGLREIDEEWLAQAMHRAQCDLVWYTTAGDLSVRDDMQRHREDAAAIAKVYREDTDDR